MPFTIDGQWTPSPSNKSQKPVKVRLVKRGKSILTVILNLNVASKELSALCSTIKKKLGCGGAVKEGDIEFQGDQVEQVTKYLKAMGVNPS